MTDSPNSGKDGANRREDQEGDGQHPTRSSGRPPRPPSRDTAVKAFAADLDQLRRDAELNLKELAAKAHCAPSTLSKATKGDRLPTWDTTKAYALGCGADIELWKNKWELANSAAYEQPAQTTSAPEEGPPEVAEPQHIPTPRMSWPRRHRLTLMTMASISILSPLAWSLISATSSQQQPTLTTTTTPFAQPTATCPDGKPRATGSAPAVTTEIDYKYVAEIHCPPSEGQKYYAVIEYPKSENAGFERSTYIPQLKDSDSVPPSGTYTHRAEAKDRNSTRYLYIISCTPNDWNRWTFELPLGVPARTKWPGIQVSNISPVTRK